MVRPTGLEPVTYGLEVRNGLFSIVFQSVHFISPY